MTVLITGLSARQQGMRIMMLKAHLKVTLVFSSMALLAQIKSKPPCTRYLIIGTMISPLNIPENDDST